MDTAPFERRQHGRACLPGVSIPNGPTLYPRRPSAVRPHRTSSGLSCVKRGTSYARHCRWFQSRPKPDHWLVRRWPPALRLRVVVSHPFPIGSRTPAQASRVGISPYREAFKRNWVGDVIRVLCSPSQGSIFATGPHRIGRAPLCQPACLQPVLWSDVAPHRFKHRDSGKAWSTALIPSLEAC